MDIIESANTIDLDDDFENIRDTTSVEYELQRLRELTPIERKLIEMGTSDNDNAHAFILLCKGEVLYDDSFGFMTYNGKYWEEGFHVVRNLVCKVINKRKEVAKKANKMQMFRSLSADSVKVTGCMTDLKSTLNRVHGIHGEQPQFDTYYEVNDKGIREEVGRYLQNFENCVVDIRTKETFPHDPKYMFTHVKPVEYHEDAKTEEVYTFFESSVGGGSEGIKYLMQVLGSGLIGSNEAKKFFWFQGPTNSGKGTTKDFYKSVSGKSTVEIGYEMISAQRKNDTNNFDLGLIDGKRALFTSEPSTFQEINESLIKKLTGDGDELTYAPKFGKHRTFTPVVTPFILSNFRIMSKSTDDAFYERLVVITFPNKRTMNNEPGVEKADTSLKKNLIGKKENREAFVAMLVNGAFEWYNENRSLVPPDCFMKETIKQRNECDLIRMTIEEGCIKDPKGFISSDELFQIHESLCKEYDLDPMKKTPFCREMSTKGFKPDRQQVSGKYCRGFLGLKPKPEETHKRNKIISISAMEWVQESQSNR